MPEIGPPGLTRRGLETGSRRTYTGTKLETADTAKGSLRGTAPVLDPTTLKAERAPNPERRRVAFLRIGPVTSDASPLDRSGR